MKVNFSDLPKNTKTPILTYCRKLISEGVDPETELEVYRDQKAEPDILIIKIGKASELTVNEEPNIHFVKYRSFSRLI